MKVRNIGKARAELSALVAAAERGEEVVLTRAGKPVARIVPFGQTVTVKVRKPGSMKGEIWIAPDFESLPDYIAKSMGVIG